MKTLADIGEDALVRRITAKLTTDDSVILGPGDDTSGGRPVLGQGSLGSSDTTIPVTTSAPISELVVWLTELPKSRRGAFPYLASIGEVEVSGA